MRYLTEAEKNWSDSRLEYCVFNGYPSGEADKRFFKQKIQHYLSDDKIYKSFSQYMFECIWERNDQGHNGKYTYFNDRAQSVFIDKYFYEWMCRMIKKIETELIKMKEYGK